MLLIYPGESTSRTLPIHSLMIPLPINSLKSIFKTNNDLLSILDRYKSADLWLGCRYY